jgi:NodT family efflux transporter outer membrane factor (OMF) lipoprotein
MVQLALPLLGLMRAPLTAAVVAVTALAGCALSTPPGHEQVLQDALPQGTAVPATWQTKASSGAVMDDWLKSFNDPKLEALVAEAIANNRDLAQAAERVRVAQQAVRVVGARLLPQVGAQAGARAVHDEDHDGSATSDIVYAGVAWEADVWGRLRAQRAATAAAASGIALDYAYARQSLAATVAKAWYLATETRQLLALAKQSVKVYGELLKLVEIRRKAGKDTDLNIADTRAKLEMAHAQVQTASAAYGEAHRALEVLLGRYPAAEIEAAGRLPPLPPSAAAGVPASLIQRRPDLVAAEKRVIAAFRKEEAARLAFFPDFGLSLVGGRLGDQILSVLRLNPWLASAAIGMSIPIYEGGALRAKVEIANAEQARAVAAYGAAVLAAFQEVENALANERLIARRLPFEQSALANSKEAVRLAKIQYQAGSRDLLWVSSLQADELVIEGVVIKTRQLQRTNRINLYLALGGSFDAPPPARPAEGRSLPKPGPNGRTQLILSPLGLIERIAALVPPRQHRHRYYGVLAPNVPLWAAVTALAPEAVAAQPSPTQTSGEAPQRAPARYLWAMLPARIYEAFPLTCPKCGSEMRVLAFITEAAPVQRILRHIGEPATPPPIAPARGPPSWEEADSGTIILDEERFAGDPLAQPEPECELDQRLSW